MKDVDQKRERANASERLRRLLNLVPVIRANPGITISALRTLGGFASPRETREELGRLMLFGVPPYSPADFIEIQIDADDKVTLHFPQGLDKPLALTPEEWSSVQGLLMKELEFHPAGSPSMDLLRSVLAKMSAVPVSVDAGDPVSVRRRLVEEAMEDELQVQFLYRTLSSKDAEIRRVDPWAIFQNRGFLYLVGHDHLRQAPRHFHLERTEDLVILEVPRETEPPENLEEILKESPFFRDSKSGFSVDIAFTPDAEAAVERYLGVDQPRDSVSKSGWREGSCRVRDSFWFRGMVRSFGGRVIIQNPAHMRESFLAELKEIPVPEALP
ncbi:MAG: WYL domain-containing protein [Spirochaetia bacterium]|nr:WYL domain-containing protein [Spirochaetia bacterium]